MKNVIHKEVAYERVLFFTDAVVAIAITLLALDLKLDIHENQHLTFIDLITPWQKYVAFILSFINIAGFWRIHHDFFIYIKKIDTKLLILNTAWVFFIITLPFATTLVSQHFDDAPAIFLYSLNTFLLSVCQNFIWDYADSEVNFTEKTNLSFEEQNRFRWMLNLDMLNCLIAIGLSFFYPKIAFFLLFFKFSLFVFITLFKTKMSDNERIPKENQTK